jgi:hypothetical protein
MKKDFVNFFKGFSLLVAIMALVSFVLERWLPEVKISGYWIWILLFLYAFTLFLYGQLLKEFRSRLSRFSNTLMLVNFGKMMLYVLIIGVFSWFNRPEAPSFAITFLVYYAMVTFFEIRKLLSLK